MLDIHQHIFMFLKYVVCKTVVWLRWVCVSFLRWECVITRPVMCLGPREKKTPTRTHRSLTGHLCTAKHTQRMFHLHRAKQLSSPAHYLIKDRRHLCPLTSLDDWPCYHTHTAPLTHAEARRGIKTLLHEVSSGATQHFKNGCSAASSSACAIHHS